MKKNKKDDDYTQCLDSINEGESCGGIVDDLILFIQLIIYEY